MALSNWVWWLCLSKQSPVAPPCLKSVIKTVRSFLLCFFVKMMLQSRHVYQWRFICCWCLWHFIVQSSSFNIHTHVELTRAKGIYLLKRSFLVSFCLCHKQKSNPYLECLNFNFVQVFACYWFFSSFLPVCFSVKCWFTNYSREMPTMGLAKLLLSIILEKQRGCLPLSH